MKKIIISLIAIMATMSINAQVVKVYKNGSTTPEKTFLNTDKEKYSVVFQEEEPEGQYNGREYVDLNLPSGVCWATTNVGADTPEAYGQYFAWGETSSKTSFSWSNYTLCGGSGSSLNKYCTSSSYGTVDDLEVLESDDDAATDLWGGPWRMPTDEDFEELKDYCTWKWDATNKGYTVTGSNGNSIFLPASALNNEGAEGYYWTSSLHTDYNSRAYCLSFDSSVREMSYANRYLGYSIRPVLSPEALKEQPTCSFPITSHIINVGETYLQELSTISDGNVTYTSSNSDVATVNPTTGRVTGVAKGTATITARVSASAIYNEDAATYTIKVTNTSSDGCEYVDLGLPSGKLWATMNLGATSIADNAATAFGDYYTWGELDTYYSSYQTYNEGTVTFKESGKTHITGEKTAYDCTNYCGSESFTEWSTVPYDSVNILTADYDIVNQTLGGNWHMPTPDDFIELYEACDFPANGGNVTESISASTDITLKGIYYIDASSSAITIDGTTYHVSGLLFVADDSDTSKRVFFPGAGRLDGTITSKAGGCYYWSSKTYASNLQVAYYMTGNGNLARPRVSAARYYGQSVRPVLTVDDPAYSFKATISVGDTYPLNLYTQYDGTATYLSSKEDVATVDASGVVTGVSVGYSKITVRIPATDTHEATSAVYRIIVDRKTPVCNFSSTTCICTVGGTYAGSRLTTTSDGAVTYTSGNPSVATVDSSTGEITALAAGNSIIVCNTAMTDTYKKGSAFYNVKVNRREATCKFLTNYLNLNTGDTNDTQTLLTPSDGTVTYASNNSSVATVNATTGEVTAVALGTAVITASVAQTDTYEFGSATYLVRVGKVTPSCSFSVASKDMYKKGIYTNTLNTTSNGTVTYSTSEPVIAAVDETTGRVTALRTGTAIITATIQETSSCAAVSASYTVNVVEPEYVDLGLVSKTLWATCNVGAASPEDYGYYFAWGETTPHTYDDTHVFDLWHYHWYDGATGNLTKYKSGTMDNDDDAAYANWGTNWCIPTETQWKELIGNTMKIQTTQNGMHGIKFVSKTNGNSIFLPAADYFYEDKWMWTSTGWYFYYMAQDNSGKYYCKIFYANGSEGEHYGVIDDCKFYGYPVRPVLRK